MPPTTPYPCVDHGPTRIARQPLHRALLLADPALTVKHKRRYPSGALAAGYGPSLSGNRFTGGARPTPPHRPSPANAPHRRMLALSPHTPRPYLLAHVTNPTNSAPRGPPPHTARRLLLVSARVSGPRSTLTPRGGDTNHPPLKAHARIVARFELAATPPAPPRTRLLPRICARRRSRGEEKALTPGWRDDREKWALRRLGRFGRRGCLASERTSEAARNTDPYLIGE